MANKKHIESHQTSSESQDEVGPRLEAIVNSAVFAIITIDDAGLIEDFNPAAQRMFGYSTVEVIGKDVNMLMPQPYASEHGRYIQHYLDTGERKIIGSGRRVVAQRKNGEKFPIHLTVSEINAVNRRMFTGMIHDITEQVEAEHKVHELIDELQHVARVSAMGEMASSLAHEMNQPLTAISNYASAARRMLESGVDDSVGKASDFILQASEQALRAGEVIRRLRSFIELGETERVSQDLESAVREAAQLSFIGEHTKNISVNWIVEDDLPFVSIDRVQIQQVFQNLIRNAVDVLVDKDDEKNITLKIQRLGDKYILVTIEDNGPGIDAKVKERLFEPFVTSKKNGMGLGLSISRTIIESHGGQISVEDPKSGGARFSITLPIAPR